MADAAEKADSPSDGARKKSAFGGLSVPIPAQLGKLGEKLNNALPSLPGGGKKPEEEEESEEMQNMTKEEKEAMALLQQQKEARKAERQKRRLEKALKKAAKKNAKKSGGSRGITKEEQELRQIHLHDHHKHSIHHKAASLKIFGTMAGNPLEIDAKQVRFTPLETRGGFAEMSGFRFYDPEGDEIKVRKVRNLDENGKDKKKNRADSLIDGKDDTVWSDTLSEPVIFKFSKQVHIGFYHWATGDDWYNDPVRWLLEASNDDGKEWDIIDDNSEEDYPVGDERFELIPKLEIDFKCSSVRFTPLAFRSTKNSVHLASMRFYDNYGSQILAKSATNAGGKCLKKCGVSNVIDGSTATKWVDTAMKPISFRFQTKMVSIAYYEFATPEDNPALDPIKWTMEFTADGKNWQNCDDKKDARGAQDVPFERGKYIPKSRLCDPEKSKIAEKEEAERKARKAEKKRLKELKRQMEREAAKAEKERDREAKKQRKLEKQRKREEAEQERLEEERLLNERRAAGHTLSVAVVEARGLPTQSMDALDPYAKVTVQGVTHQTEKLPDAGATPVWDEELPYFVVESLENQAMRVEIWDEDSFSKDDPLGHCEIDLKVAAGVHAGQHNETWFTLEPQGEVFLSVQYLECDREAMAHQAYLDAQSGAETGAETTNGETTGGESDFETDGQTDGETDREVSAEMDGETDGEAGAETDADAESDTESDATIQTNAATDVDSDTESDTDGEPLTTAMGAGSGSGFEVFVWDDPTGNLPHELLLELEEDAAVRLKATKDGAVVKEWEWEEVTVKGEAAETEEEMDTIRLVEAGSGMVFSFECEDYEAIAGS